MNDGFPIVDAHLDLAYNATRGRDVTKPAREQPPVGEEIATVGLPDLVAGNVKFVCATIFCEPASSHSPEGYRTADEAHEQALRQLAWYRQQFDTKTMRCVRTREDLSHGRDARVTVSSILLLEGAEALRSPDDVRQVFDEGIRIVGLAWQRTRYAGGTGQPGPLTVDGIAIVKELDRAGIIHDASHLAEQSFWQLLDRASGPVIASHSNCRSIVGGPGNRHLTDDMIRAIVERGGVIGINFFDRFLLPKTEQGHRRATLSDIVAHAKHICDLADNSNHVGLGSDMDGGLGRDQIPQEITTSADLPRVAEALSGGGFNDDDVGRIMGGNWLSFLRRTLPAG
jgi:membrane dipeptidase